MNKTRPSVIVAPDELNRNVRTTIICPMTGSIRNWPTRVPVDFAGKSGDIALDQIRTVDKSRLIKRLGSLERRDAERVSEKLEHMFRF